MPRAEQGSCEYHFKVFWSDSTRGMNPRSTDCKADALITTPSRWCAQKKPCTIKNIYFCKTSLIGALYGRAIGQAMVTWFGVFTPNSDPFWAWIDPGAMALIGAASFFGGVSRLTMSLTVIMVKLC